MKELETYLGEMEKIAQMPTDCLRDSVIIIKKYEEFFKKIYMDGFNDGVNTSIKSLDNDI